MKVLMLMAHPDDEVIFGWPELFHDEDERRLLLCSGRHSESARDDEGWADALQEVVNLVPIQAQVLDYARSFYLLPSRGVPGNRTPDQEKLRLFQQDVIATVRAIEKDWPFDAIFTHNPAGEYGHQDHKLLWSLAMGLDRPLLFTDVFMPSNWTPLGGLSDAYKTTYHRKHVRQCALDSGRYMACKAIYMKHNAWTWSKPPVSSCGLWRLDP